MIGHDPVIAGVEIAASVAGDLVLPTLDEVLREFSTRAFLDIELKVKGAERELIDALREHAPQRGYVVSSFLPEALEAVHILDSSIPLGFLYERRQPAVPCTFPLAYLIPHFTLLSRELVEEAHGSGRKIVTWTVNRADDMQPVCRLGRGWDYFRRHGIAGAHSSLAT